MPVGKYVMSATQTSSLPPRAYLPKVGLEQIRMSAKPVVATGGGIALCPPGTASRRAWCGTSSGLFIAEIAFSDLLDH